MDNVEMDAMVADYLAGMNVLQLAHKHRHTNRTISRILREAGVLGTLQRRRDAARRGKPSPAHLRNVQLACPPTADEWPSIAGLFDGEGSVVAYENASLGNASLTPEVADARDGAGGGADRAVEANRNTSGHRRYRVSIVQKDVTPLVQVKQVLGVGCIYFANGTHRYQLAGQRAVFDFLCGVLPYLIVKREGAEAAVAALATSYGWDRKWDGERDGERGAEGVEREVHA